MMPRMRGPKATPSAEKENSAPANASPALPVHPAPEPSPPVQVNPSSVETPLIENTVSRRSGRTVIKNTRLERQNLIGSNVISHPPAPGASSDSAEVPTWFLTAVHYLKDGDLGEEWTVVLDKWAALEESLGFGKVAKVRGYTLEARVIADTIIFRPHFLSPTDRKNG